MTTHGLRTLVAAVFTASGLLAACSSSSLPTRAHRPITASGGSATTFSSPSASPATTVGGTPLGSTPPTGHVRATPLAAGSAAACSLVTEQDATAEMGADPGKGSADDRPGATQCIYGSYRTQVLLVNVVWLQGKADYAHARTDPKLLQVPGSRIADITGMGDQAFELFTPHTDALYFTKGDKLIIVALSTRTTPPNGAALGLAKIAARRL